MSWLEQKADKVRLRLWVTPRASSDQIVGVAGDSLRVKIKAVPQKGKANGRLIAFMAESLRVPAGWIEIDSGAGGRRKGLLVSGLSPEDVEERLIRNSESGRP